MSRIAYVNGRYRPLARRHRPYRGPRLSVFRRRLRGLRGEGRAHGRRAPPHGAARAFAGRAAHRDADVAGGARHGDARDHRAATASATASSTCRSPAAWRGATTPSRRRDGAERRGHRAHARSFGQRGAGSERHRRRHRAGQPLGPRRHQVGGAVAQCARQADGPRAGRARGLVRGSGRQCHRGLVQQRLDRDPGRQGGHPCRRQRHPARHHPGRPDRGDCARRAWPSRSGRSRSRRPMPPARPS